MNFQEVATKVSTLPHIVSYSHNQITIYNNANATPIGSIRTQSYGPAVMTLEDSTCIGAHVPQQSYVLIVSGKLYSIICPRQTNIIYSSIREKTILSWNIIANELQTLLLTLNPFKIPGGFWVGSNSVALILQNPKKATGISIVHLNDQALKTTQRCFNQLYLIYTIAARAIQEVCETLHIPVCFKASPEITPLAWEFPF